SGGGDRRRVDREPILVVEDSPTQAVALATLLEEAGHAVLIAGTGEAALETMRKTHVELVLTDIVMPGIDGYQLCRQVKAEWSDIPVILLTSLTDPLAIVRGLESGADHYVTKPYDPVQLLARVGHVLGRASDTKALVPQPVRVELMGTPFTISATKEQILELLVSSYGDLVRASEIVRAAEQRARFLADAGVLLSTSLDPAEILGSLARLCVPYIADLCIVDLVDAAGCVTRVAAASTDPAFGIDAAPMIATAPSSDPRHPYRIALATGQPQIVGLEASGLVEISKETPVVAAYPAPTCAVVAPLMSRDRVLGALSFISYGSRTAYVVEDVALASDVARRSALALENARLYQEAQRATQARDDVLALVSHDLRSPLGTVQMSASFLLEMLETPGATPPFEQQLKIIKRAVTRADRLIGDLLDVSRIESGTLEVKHSPLDASQLLVETVEEHRPIAQEKNITLATEWVGPTTIISGDRDRISQLFSNLIGNALKFTPADGVVSVTGVAGPKVVTFSVSDSGPGIPVDHLPQLFNRFWQANRATRSGAGLGLSIAKGIAEAHGGTLVAESVAGEGARFAFTIPVWEE
ncbi:MAG TPA: ATP-binding protein, partial [Gemmatimonadaceae bacterium]|nr:ATP-binding protein [Gemmatimonadaceae bacterium]